MLCEHLSQELFTRRTLFDREQSCHTLTAASAGGMVSRLRLHERHLGASLLASGTDFRRPPHQARRAATLCCLKAPQRCARQRRTLELHQGGDGSGTGPVDVPNEAVAAGGRN